MYKTFIILLLSLFINTFAKAQSIVPSIVIGRDTLPHVTLDEVNVLAKRINARKYARQQKRNHRLAHNVRKALPYAKIAAAKINEIEGKRANYQRRIQATHEDIQKTSHEPDRHARENTRASDLPGNK